MSHREHQRAALARLRDRFERAADQHPRISVSMIHTGPGERHRLKDPPRPISDHPMLQGGIGVYGESRNRRYWFGRDPEGVSRFQLLAKQAAEVLSGFPAPEGVHAATLRSRGTSRWLWTVFDLAWRNRAGSPLRARKMGWQGGTTFPYGFASPQRALYEGFRACGHEVSGPESPADEPPEAFYSSLPDVLLASAYTVCVLADLIDGGEHEVVAAMQPGSDLKENDPTAYEALVFIRSRQPVSGPRIDRHIHKANDHFKNHVARKLRGYGLKSKIGRGGGYYFPEGAEAWKL